MGAVELFVLGHERINLRDEALCPVQFGLRFVVVLVALLLPGHFCAPASPPITSLRITAARNNGDHVDHGRSCFNAQCRIPEGGGAVMLESHSKL